MHGNDGLAGTRSARDPGWSVEDRSVGDVVLTVMQKGAPLREWSGKHLLEFGFVGNDVEHRLRCRVAESADQILVVDLVRFDAAHDVRINRLHRFVTTEKDERFRLR